MMQTSYTMERHSALKRMEILSPATTHYCFRAGASSTKRTNAVGCQGLPHCHHHTQGQTGFGGMSSLSSSVGSPPRADKWHHRGGSWEHVSRCLSSAGSLHTPRGGPRAPVHGAQSQEQGKCGYAAQRSRLIQGKCVTQKRGPLPDSTEGGRRGSHDLEVPKKSSTEQCFCPHSHPSRFPLQAAIRLHPA